MIQSKAMFLPVPESVFKQIADSSLLAKSEQKVLKNERDIKKMDQSTKVKETPLLIDNQHVIQETEMKTDGDNTEILGDWGEYEKPPVAKMRAKGERTEESALESE